MEQRQLGKSGPMVSLVGLGCNNFGGRIDADASRKVIHRALDLGITFFDTADSYGARGGSEECLGRFLGERRKDIVLGTKFGLPFDGSQTLQGASRRYVMTAVEASLKRLKTDWIDLYQLHRPDPQTPIADTLQALNDLIRQGKVRSIGCSNLSAAQVSEAQQIAQQQGLQALRRMPGRIQPAGAQGRARVLSRPCERHGMGLVPFFPLAGGMLTGKYRRNAALPAGAASRGWRTSPIAFMTPANSDKVERLSDFCAQRGRSLLALAFSWLAAQPVVASVIAGASTTEQLDQNLAGGRMDADARGLAGDRPDHEIGLTSTPSLTATVESRPPANTRTFHAARI